MYGGMEVEIIFRPLSKSLRLKLRLRLSKNKSVKDERFFVKVFLTGIHFARFRSGTPEQCLDKIHIEIVGKKTKSKSLKIQ